MFVFLALGELFDVHEDGVVHEELHVGEILYVEEQFIIDKVVHCFGRFSEMSLCTFRVHVDDFVEHLVDDIDGVGREIFFFRLFSFL